MLIVIPPTAPRRTPPADTAGACPEATGAGGVPDADEAADELDAVAEKSASFTTVLKVTRDRLTVTSDAFGSAPRAQFLKSSSGRESASAEPDGAEGSDDPEAA